jgi:hypothetical protein
MAWVGVPLVVVAGFAFVVALQWFGVIKAWQNARRWRATASWSEVPWPGRIIAAVAVVVGLAGGVLLAAAAHRGR